MLIASMVRRTLGIKRHVVKRVEEMESGLVVTLDVYRGRRQACSCCGTLGRVRDRLKERAWKHVPLWGIPVTLRYRPARVRCPQCQKVCVEAIPWSQGKCRLSSGLIWLLSTWCKLLSWDQVATLFGVHWNTVATAVREAVSYGLAHRDLGGVLYIGIDELSRQKGHVYVTNVYDLQEKRLLWSGEGRSQDTLRAFFAEHGEALKDKVRGVCCDMWQPYIDMVKDHFPDAVLVFDRFHIMQQLLRAVDEVRRAEARELKKTNPELLKRTRYIWLKNPENLTDKQTGDLDHLSRLNLHTAKAYQMRLALQDLYRHTLDPLRAHRRLKAWARWTRMAAAKEPLLEPMARVGRTLLKHLAGVLAHWEIRLTNAYMEGLMSVFSATKRKARGYRSFAYLRDMLYFTSSNLDIPSQPLCPNAF